MMSISEARRRAMHAAFVTRFGEDVGDTVMAHLPPVGWADVATKQDLAHLREVLEARMDAWGAQLRGELHAEIGSLRGEMGKQTWRFVGMTLAAVIAVSGLPQVIASL